MHRLKEVFVFIAAIVSFALFNSCNKTVGNQGKKMTMDSSVIEKEILLQLKPEMQIDSFIQHFKKTELILRKEISRTMNLWLVSFDEKKNKPAKVLARIKKHPFVQSAEFNRKVQIREEQIR